MSNLRKMITFDNPALKGESSNEPAHIIRGTQSESILDWLKRTNRFKYDDIDKYDDHNLTEDLEEIMGVSVSILEEE